MKVLSLTTIQHLTFKEPRNTNVQENIRDCHVSLEAVHGSEEFGTSLDGYYSFVDDYEEVTEKVGPNEEEYQGLPDLSYITVMNKGKPIIMTNTFF